MRSTPHSRTETPWRSGEKAGAKELENQLQGFAGGFTGFVDQVLGEHRVWGNRCVGIGILVVELNGHECVTQLLSQELEAFGRESPWVSR